MSDSTKIQWAEHTGGPYLGCSCVSPGCTHCYAMALALTRLEPIFRKAYQKAGFEDWQTRPVWGDKATRVLSKGFWNDVKRINAQHAREGTRGRWFPSMIDWLDTRPAGIIDQDGTRLDPLTVLADFLKLIHGCSSLDFLLLTKRPENFFPLIQTVWRTNTYTQVGQWTADWVENANPPENIWIGVSVEDQQRADERIPALLGIPARVRFLSVEPLLGPLDLQASRLLACQNHGACFPQDGRRLIIDSTEGGMAAECVCSRLNGIHWVIVGGESGPGARPCHMDWIRSVANQCRSANTPCFVKQLGADPRHDYEGEGVELLGPVTAPATIRINNGPLNLKDHKGGNPTEWPADLQIRQFPTPR